MIERYLALGTWVLSVLFLSGVQLDKTNKLIPKNPFMFIPFVIGAIMAWPAVLIFVIYLTGKRLNREEKEARDNYAALHKQAGKDGTINNQEPRNGPLH